MMKDKIFEKLNKLYWFILSVLLSFGNLLSMSVALYFGYSWFFYEKGFPCIPFYFFGFFAVFLLIAKQEYSLLFGTARKRCLYGVVGIGYNSLFLFGFWFCHYVLKF